MERHWDSDREPVIRWLRQRAIPLHSVDRGTGFEDFEPLRSVLENVRIVGLGEATHGTHEFFRLKHRFVEFLVLEMGFTALAWEASYASAYAVNDYVVDGIGDRDAALSRLRYLAFDTEEVAALLDWLRIHNQRVPEERKVRFYGLDHTFNEDGIARVGAYLEQVAPASVPSFEPVFRLLAREESKWPMQIDDRSRQASAEIRAGLQDVLVLLDGVRHELSGDKSKDELGRIRHQCQMMLESAAFDNNNRSRDMGENLLALIDQEIGERNVIFCGHNYHVGVESFTDKPPTCGYVLRQRYAEGYFAFAFEYGAGSYQARSAGADGLGALVNIDVGPAPHDTLPGWLDDADIGDSITIVRGEPDDPEVERWLTRPLMAHANVWVAMDPDEQYEPVSLRTRYDGVVFVETSTPAHPTRAALANASRGLWL